MLLVLLVLLVDVTLHPARSILAGISLSEPRLLAAVGTIGVM